MKKVINRKARYNYELGERIEAGIVLTGAEVKSVKDGKISLDESFSRIDPNGEVWLVNCHIHPYRFADNRNYDPTRSRKLLLKKHEILSLFKKTENKNLTIVPTAAYSQHNRIKIELAIGKGKKKWDKREAIKKRDLDREARRLIRQK
jgi:SsrA-binding protein